MWNYLCGYVIIRIRGLGIERFVNYMLEEGVEIWDVQREEDGSVSAKVSVAGFYALHKKRRREGWSVSIEKKRGLIMRLSALRRRKILLYGWVPVFLILMWASRMIWVIDVAGCDAVDSKDVLAILDEAGVRVGSKRRGLDVNKLSLAVRTGDSRIAMATVGVSGVRMSVDVYETGHEPNVIDESVPADIIAAKDGLIISVVALKGHAVVNSGDTVKAGDMLITGDLTREGGEPLMVCARGSVTAETVYTASAADKDAHEAVRAAEEVLLKQMDGEAVIIEKSSRMTLREDGTTLVTLAVTAREDIAVSRELE